MDTTGVTAETPVTFYVRKGNSIVLYSATTKATPTSAVTLYDFLDSALNITGATAGYYTGYAVMGSVVSYLKVG